MNKQGVHPWPRNASKSTHLLGVHVEQGAVVGCLALHFSHSALIRALQTSGVICKHKHLVERGGSQALMSPHIIYQPLKEMKRKKKKKKRKKHLVA